MKIKVTHPTFGTGTVIENNDKNVKVDFNGIIKNLMTKFSKLTYEDGTLFGTQFVAKVKKVKVNEFTPETAREKADRIEVENWSDVDLANWRRKADYNSISW